MNIRMHENGWTPIIEDLDWKTITQDEVNELAKLLLTNTMLVSHQDGLTADDEVRVGSMFGSVEQYSPDVINDNFIFKNGGSNHILRVTGEKDEKGSEGMFGHVTELDWHCNRVTQPNRKPIIWLFSERGSVGSRTSYINFHMVYNDLTDEQKELYETLSLDVGEDAFSDYYNNPAFGRYYPKMIHTNKLGIKSLFMPFTQVHFIKDWDKPKSRELIEQLRDMLLDPKYVYHHDWKDNDIVVADQWSGIHKRWEFAGMPNRVLHRMATDYSNTPYC